MRSLRRKPVRRPRSLVAPESLEDRTLLSISLTGVPDWSEQGPGPILNAHSLIGSDNPAVGAVQALAADPHDPNILFAGTVNGGIWRTSHALDANPHWLPLTDAYPTLSIGALAYSPADPTPTVDTAADDTLYAGTGQFSSASRTANQKAGFGVLKSTDGGANWTVLASDTFGELNINSIVPTMLSSGQVVLAATLNGTFAGKPTDRGGLYRSDDGGVHWIRVSGNTGLTGNLLPDAGVSDLVADPSNPLLFYAAVPGRNVERSVDGGLTWQPILAGNLASLLPANVLARSKAIRLAVSPVDPHPVFASVIDANGNQAGVFQWSGGTTWTQIGTGPAPASNLGHQGQFNGAILADPVKANLVYVSGDRGADGIGNIFVGDANVFPKANAWSPIVGQGANDTTPHADSRRLVLAADGSILEADDGGVYRLSSPSDPAARTWTSLNQGLRDTEFYSVAYDPLNNVIIGGSQDNGVAEQNPALPDGTWTLAFHGPRLDSSPNFAGGDGAAQAVDASDPSQTIRYSEQNSLGLFFRSAFNNQNLQLDIGNAHGQTNPQDPLFTRNRFLSATVMLASADHPTVWESGLNSSDRTSFNNPFVLNAIDAHRMLIGGTGLYESLNQGDTIRNIAPAGMPRVTALAYGGFEPFPRVGLLPNPDVAYVGAGGSLYLRSSAPGGFHKLTGFPALSNGQTLGQIRGIALDPNDWHTAYVITGDHVLQGTGIGTQDESWKDITGNLPKLQQVSELGSLQSVGFKAIQAVRSARTGGHLVLLLGDTAGVYRLADPDPATNTAWSKFGAGLPNAMVTSLVYDDQADVLVVGTLGRGAWKITDAGAFMVPPGDLPIAFNTDHDTIRLVRDANNPLLLDVVVNNVLDPANQFVLSDIPHITVTGMGGSDTLIVDSSHGVIAVPRGIRYVGDGSLSALQVRLAPGDTEHVTASSPFDGTVVVTGALGGTSGGTISYTGVGLPPIVPPAQFPDDGSILAGIRNGLEAFAPQVRAELDTALASQDFIAGLSFGGMLNSEVTTAPATEGDSAVEAAGPTDPVSDDGSSVLLRLIESGQGGFSLGDIGGSITSLDDLRAHLAALDPNSGQVTLTQNGGITRFDVLIHKTLSGQAVLDTQALGGKVDLSGTVDLSADVTFHLIFGVDADGFFIDPISTLDPLLAVSNLQIDGEVQGSGRFGFTNVLVSGGTLAVDPSVKFALGLNQTDPDPFTGQFDHRIRLDQLDPTNPGLAVAQWQGSSGPGPDVVFTPTLDVAPLDPDSAAPFSLGTDPAQVSLTWDHVTSAADPTVAGVNTTGTTLADFLNLSASQLVGGLAGLAADFPGLVQLKGSVLGSSFALTGSSLGSLLSGPASNFTVDGASVARVSAVSQEGIFNKFVVSLSQGTFPAGTVALGDTVTYAGLDDHQVSRTVQGVIDSLEPGQFTVRFDANLVQVPDPTNHTFTIAHSDTLQHQLQASLGGLLDPATANAEAPTIQDLLLKLADLTGADPGSFAVSLTGTGDLLGLQVGIDFHPQPVVASAGLDLSSLVTGLKLGGNSLAFTIAPEIHLVAGLLLSPTLPSTRDRFFLAPDATPTISLHVSAAPAAPLSGTGTVGFLNVRLQPDGSIAANPGLTIAGTLTATLTDPGTEANDGHIGLAELRPSDLSTLFATGMATADPLVVNIPGLQIAATVGNSPPAPIEISLDGSGAGRLATLTDLTGLSQAITVQGKDSFTGYNNISPDNVVEVLTGLARQLGVAGGGGALGQTLPMIGHSLSSAIDLAQQYEDHVGMGYDLQLMSWGDGSGVPTSGRNLVVVGTDTHNLLHIRIFDATGNRTSDTVETQLPAQTAAITTLKQSLPGLLSPHELTNAEKAQVLAEVSSILGQTLGLPRAADVPTAQDLLNFLTARLGASVSLTATAGDLDISLSFSADADKAYTVGLALGSGLSSLVRTSGSGQVTLQVHSDVHLAFGIGTGTGPVSDRAFVDTANTDISVLAVADAGYNLGQGATPDLSFTAGLGPLTSVGVSHARVLLRPSFDAHLQAGSSTPGRVALSALTADSVVGTLGGDAQAIIPLQAGPNSAEVEVAVLLAQAVSISYDSDNDPNYTPNPSTTPQDPGTLTGFHVFVHNLSGLVGQLPALPANPSSNVDLSALTNLTNGLDPVLDRIYALLNDNALGKIDLPVIGKLSDGAHFIKDLEDQLKTILNDLAATDAAAGTTPSPADVQQALLHGGTLSDGATHYSGLLAQDGHSPLIPSGTIVVQADGDHVQFAMHIHESYTLASTSLAADFGIPGLGFHIDPGTILNVTLPIDFAFGFGYSRADGVYLDTNAPAEVGMQHAFSIGVTADIASLHATGQLGFLRLTASPVTDMSSRPVFDGGASFGVNVKNPAGGDRLSASELAAADLGDVLSASFSGHVDAAVHVAADLNTDEFPSIGADLLVHWAFDDGSFSGGVPDVSFQHVSLDLGTYFSGYVAPIVHRVQDMLGPLKPVFDFLTKPLPVISQLRGSDYTVLDAAGYGYLDPIAGVIDKILGLNVPTAGGNMAIDLGSFDLGGRDVRGISDLTSVIPNITSIAQDAVDQIKAHIPGSLDLPFLAELQTTAAAGTTGLQFPLLDDPKIGFNLLLGKPVDLFRFSLPDLDLQEHESEFFPILGPLGVRLIGDLTVHTKMVFGYDTAGFMESTIHPLDGFFIDDTSAVMVHAKIEADAELNVVVAQVGVGGGILGDVTVSMHDPNDDGFHADGKLRLNEIASDLSDGGPLGLFDAKGQVLAFLHAYVQVGLDTPFGFVGWSDSFDIAHSTLLDFDTTRVPPPVLAHQDGGKLTLGMGPHSGLRQHLSGDTGVDGDETFTVSQTPGGSTAAGSEAVTVTYKGFTQKFTGVSQIYAEGGYGNNTIIIKPEVTAPATLFAAFDPNDAQLTPDQRNYANTAPSVVDEVTGGAGGKASDGTTTTITGGPGENHLNAGSGLTTITGGIGRNIIHGGSDRDTLTGGAGDNEIYGGTGVSTLTGGGGTNLIQAGTGDDTLIAGGTNSSNTFLVVDPAGSVLKSLAGGLQITGGGKSSTLELTQGGGAGYTETYTYPNSAPAGSPTIVTTNGTLTQSIHATGLTGILDTVTANAMTFTAPAAVDPIQIVNGTQQYTGSSGPPASSNALTTIALGLAPAPLVTFSGKTTVTVNGGRHVTVDNPTPAAGLRALTLDGGTTIDVYSTAPGVLTQVLDTSGAASTVTVGKQGSTQDIKGQVVIGSLSGNHTTLVVDDSADAVSRSPIVSNAAVTNIAPVPVDFVAGGLESLTVKGGRGGNTFSVVSTGDRYTTYLDDGAGADVVDVGSRVLAAGGVVDHLVGLLSVVGANAGDVMNVDDTGSTAGKSGTLTSTRLTGLLMGQGIQYAGLMAVNVRLGTGDDDFTIAGTHTGTTRIEAGPGDDTVHIRATSGPTTVDAGTGNDKVNVGEGSVSTITATAQPDGPAPLVLIGGTGHDSVIVDDGADAATGRSGNLTAFLENRSGSATPVEVGVVSGLGMTLTASAGTTAGRVEFEGFEASEVRLGRAGTRFSVGGDAVRTSLPSGRQANIAKFVNTITGMTVVTGTSGGDTVNVVETNTLDRGTLDHSLGLLSATTVTPGDGSHSAVEQVMTAGKARGVGAFTLGYGYEQTTPIPFGASDLVVHDALVGLYLIGYGHHPGDDNVRVTHTTGANGDTAYTITFQNELANQPVLQLVAQVAPLVITGGTGADHLNVQSVREETFYQGGANSDAVKLNVDVSTTALVPLTTNGINAAITVDGGDDGDSYDVHLVGGTTASLINVLDTGGAGSDGLTVYGTAQPDLFLLRAGSGRGALAFIGLLNSDRARTAAQQPVERVNYDANLESIELDTGDGNDQVYVDDTRAKLTIDGGAGNDFFQVGQLFQTRRSPDLAGVGDGDVFATIQTTKGWLSNGISFPMTIDGGANDDTFIVFHNLAVLNLNGDDGNDTFIVQAFALVGSQDDQRAITDLSGGAGADLIKYAVDAPVNIDGGDGLDTVIVIGTEFGDDFVVTANGVFGAGLNVNYINVEHLVIDGAEGDDRFFILGTGPDLVTEVTGGLGSDLFSIGGPTPADGVISRNLHGHGGLISHNVVSSDTSSAYNGINVQGVAANVADNDEPAVVVTESDGHSSVVQGGGYDTFTVALSRPPVTGGPVTINATPPKGLVFLDDLLNAVRSGDGGVSLNFDACNWSVPQTVRFEVDDRAHVIPDLGDILLSVASNDGFTGSVATAANLHDKSGTATLTLKVGSQAFPTPGTLGLPEGLRGVYVMITESLSDPEAAGQTRLILSNTADTLTVDDPWTVIPPADAHYEILGFAGLALPNVRVRIYSEQKPELVVDQTGGSTSVAENPNGTLANRAVDTVSLRLSQAPRTGETVTVNLDGSGRLQFAPDASFATPITQLSFDASTYATPVTLYVRAIDDNVVQGARQVDLVMTATSSLGTGSGYAGTSQTITVDVADNDAPGVRVIEPNGSINVVEGGVSDNYQLVLTSAPAAGETVTVNAVAEPSRTDRGGGDNGLRSFTQTVLVSTDNVHFATSVPLAFTAANWDTPQTVYVLAVDNARVDGNDTTLFPNTPAELSGIRGPLILHGGPGEDRTGLLEREPIMLPGERNAAPSVGSVVRSTEAVGVTPATVTIDPASLRALSASALVSLGIKGVNPADLQPSDLVHLSVRITDGSAKNKVRVITAARDNGDGTWTLTLNHAWFSPFTQDASTPDATSRYTLSLTNPNLLVDERDQSDILQVRDTDNVSSYNDPHLSPNPLAVGRLYYDSTFSIGTDANKLPIPLDLFRIVGLGMGGDRVIGGQAEPGGIAFDGMENVGIDLGPGNDHFTIDATPAGAVTRLDAGAGDDVIDVKSISGHTFVDLGAGSDVVNVHNDGQQLKDLLGLLTVTGDDPQATVDRLAVGSPAKGPSINAVDEIQQVTVDATGGTFTLALDGAATGPLAFNISAADLRAALGGLATVGGPNNVAVTRAGNVYRVTFINGKGGQPVDLLTTHDLGLTNGLGARDVVNVSDAGTTAPTVGVLTSTSLTGLSTPQVDEIQSIFINATQGTFQLSYAGAATPWLPYDAGAAAIQAALLALSGGTLFQPGDLAVSRNDKVVVVRFQGNLAETNVAQLAATAGPDLLRAVEQPGGGVALQPGLIQVSTRVDGTSATPVNDMQALTVSATGGSYTLSLLGGTVTTAPIPFDASAAAVQAALQAAFAKKDPAEAFKIDVTVGRYANAYLIGFQGKLRRLNGGKGVDLLAVDTSGLAGTAVVASRVDGLNDYGVETLNVDFGSGDDVLDVQGTSAGSQGFAQAGGAASTNVALHDGNGQVFVSSNANLDLSTAPADLNHDGIPDFDFLTGSLANIRGALNLDAGTGRHRLMISNEAGTVGTTDARITDQEAHVPGADPARLGLNPNAEIWATGLAPAGISYKAAPNGNFFGGITYWTGSGDDNVSIDGTYLRPGGRTMTLLNTGLGNDHIIVNLTAGQDDYFALNTMGGAQSPEPSAITGAVCDDDTVDASGSTLPLVIFGGTGNDNIIGGSGSDVILGDFGRVQYVDPGTGQVIASLGSGGRGDFTTSQALDPAWIYSRDLKLGGNDTVQAGAGQDLIIGGAANDLLDGGLDNDLVFGDAVQLRGRTIATNSRFQALSGSRIYSDASLDGVPDSQSGQVLVNGVAQGYRNQDGTASPWARYEIDNLYHTAALQAANDNSFGNDYIAGGGGNDVLFGQLGNDVIQGDGSIASALGASPTPVSAYRDASGNLVVSPSFEAATDGDDYIEGGGGNDVLFGGLGQDDIIGGSSSLFSLLAPAQRPDGNDLIFGGAGTRIDRNNLVGPADPLSADQHARDADVLVGDNGNIFRLVGTNGVAGASFLGFNYDTFGPTRLIARAVQLLDYTPGGPAYDANAANDIGGPDEIHAEAGDDSVYGGKGNDALYGDAGNDDLIGGYGNDWISGGTGDDGILGDDGRIFTSRNGLTEPLSGLTSPVVQQAISTPGNIQTATINVTGQLKKSVDMQPYEAGGNDILYGGLGNDWIHGGAGDDAISGDEALASAYVTSLVNGAPATGASDFAHPFNPGNALSYDPSTRKFYAYDAYHPMQQIAVLVNGAARDFFLNFEAAPTDSQGKPIVDSSKAQVYDGNDAVFGDTGNDWIVGGTGADRLYGGAGDDLLNADDNLNTDGSLNDQPDPAPYNTGDTAYGGSGLDVLIANTVNDSLIDWVGEFNSYLVPFSPFGMPTISRTVQPQLPEFLDALSRSDGADQTRTTAYGPAGGTAGVGYGDPARNGEPFGELGMIIQKDAGWQQQTGAPRDPQPGNTPGTRRDTMLQSSFNNNSTLGFYPDSGTWSLSGGNYTAAPAAGDSAAVIDLDQWLPPYVEFSTTASLGKAGAKQDAFLLFNYQGQGSFMYAGIDALSGRLRIGQRTAVGWVDAAQMAANISPNASYALGVAINGSTVTLTVGNNTKPLTLQYTFTTALGGGMLGLGTDSASSSFNNVLIQRVPPAFTFSAQPSFSGGAAPFTPQAGQWAVANSLVTGTPDATGAAVSARPLAVAPSSYLEYGATVNTRATAGLVFDDYGPTNYKYAAIVAGGNQVVIGHRTPAGWFTDAVASQTITPGATYSLKVALLGKTATVSLGGTAVVGYTFSELLNDAGLGLLARGGPASFGGLLIQGDDPAYSSGGFNELAAAPAASATAVAPLDAAALGPIIRAAIRRWVTSHAIGAADAAKLAGVQFQITDLPGLALGREVGGTTIQIDATAAGYGWFIDPTPLSDSEFSRRPVTGTRHPVGPDTLAGHMDLLTVVMHEMGHALGLKDLDNDTHPGDIMDESLAPGVRRLPGGADTPAAVVVSRSAPGQAPARPAVTAAQAVPRVSSATVPTASRAGALAPAAILDRLRRTGPATKRHAAPNLGVSYGTASAVTPGPAPRISVFDAALPLLSMEAWERSAFTGKLRIPRGRQV